MLIPHYRNVKIMASQNTKHRSYIWNNMLISYNVYVNVLWRHQHNIVTNITDAVNTKMTKFWFPDDFVLFQIHVLLTMRKFQNYDGDSNDVYKRDRHENIFRTGTSHRIFVDKSSKLSNYRNNYNRTNEQSLIFREIWKSWDNCFRSDASQRRLLSTSTLFSTPKPYDTLHRQIYTVYVSAAWEHMYLTRFKITDILWLNTKCEC